MNQVVIDINNLTKKFKDRIVIDHLNLKVFKGETIGIIGPNGSGKSTLLRILSGIIKPSAGSIRIDGTVTSILDVGNGFHPDLSGRENCYMAARLKGFSDKEIKGKIDRIIEFSELDSLIDEPIKHYSNGMYLRLAFAIFEQFNSDILLLDEVLSVGDARFREKIAKVIRTFKNEGKTIIFVSHNMNEVINFCERVVHMAPQKIIDSNDVREAVDEYLLSSKINEVKTNSDDLSEIELKTNYNSMELNPIGTSNLIEITKIVFEKNDRNAFQFYYTDGIEIHLYFRILRQTSGVHLLFKIFDLSGSLIITSSKAFHENPKEFFLASGEYKINLSIPGNLLNKGHYNLSLLVAENGQLNATWDDLASFKIVQNNWIKSRPWSTTPSLILTDFPSNLDKL